MATPHDTFEGWIRDQLILKSGLVIYHAINACFALAVLVSASMTALSFAKTMNNIRTYQKLVGSTKHSPLSIDILLNHRPDYWIVSFQRILSLQS